MAGEARVTKTSAFDNLVPIDLKRAGDEVQEAYRNFVLTRVNDHCVRTAVMEGEYAWHYHSHSDECFLILEGCLEIDLEDGRTVSLQPGNAFNVPAGVVHRTRARTRTVNLCFEHLDAYTDVVFTNGDQSPTKP